MKVLIIVPTYNEAANIKPWLKALADSGVTAAVLFVDDASPDGTATVIADAAQKRNDIFCLRRPTKQGLASAYLAGFAWALQRDYQLIAQMDADLSHQAAFLPSLLSIAAEGKVAVGSRYIAGGGVLGWSKWRRWLSRWGSCYARLVLTVPIADLTGGFNVWPAEVLRRLPLANMVSNGYSFQIEMKFRAQEAGITLQEVPIVFEERRQGASKMNGQIIFEAVWRVWLLRIRSRSWQPFKRLIKFCLVGFSGFVIDFGVLLTLVELVGCRPVAANLLSFSAAVGVVFWLNKFWTFRNRQNDYARQFSQFLIVSLCGLALSSGLLSILIAWQWWYVPAKLVTVLVVAVWNFSLNNYWTFRHRAC